ncbi:MAG: hypothetical protein AAFR05_06910 [Bacteroidota bacterium]
MKKQICCPLLALLLIGLAVLPLPAQSAWERSVLLSARVDTNPASIELRWSPDATATGYALYRKELEDREWGPARVSLAGFASTYLDTEVETGRAYEYALFKQDFAVVTWDICVEPGQSLELTFSDMYGIGLCCNFGFGYYSAALCGEQVAYGDNFGWSDTTQFVVCEGGDSCEWLRIDVFPDMFPNSTSWTLHDRDRGELVASSGPRGSFIAPRPRYGFISAAIELPPREDRGELLLLVERSLWDSLAPEIAQLEMDLIRDQWRVSKRAVEPTETVAEIRRSIQEHYQQRPELEALYLLGHIPVPYSGNIYPDTHSENHQGAWSADTYYAELDGQWTDEVVDIQTAFFERNHNVPGDDKWDQDSIPSRVELQVGRVDLSRLPSFVESEVELTRRYLRKAHAFKNGEIEVERRALIDDNFGQAFAAPAASAWRNFAPMFGPDQIDEADYFGTLRNQSYLWSYGCGSGSHLSAAGIGQTSDFAQDSLLTVFTMLFGSQFGDWDNPDNFLRAPLASGLTLSNCWAGNPPWTFHHMAIGYPLGYAARRTMNSTGGVYLPGPQLVHLALLGDPSLRQYPITPLAASSLELRPISDWIELTWSPSEVEAIAGYLVYRAEHWRGPYERLSTELIQDTFWRDEQPLIGDNYYQVKVVRLEESASGTFYNQSLGLIDSVYYAPIVGTQEEDRPTDFQVHPNPSTGQVWVQLPEVRTESELQLYAPGGQLVGRWNIAAGTREQDLDLSRLAVGWYWLRWGSELRPLLLVE